MLFATFLNYAMKTSNLSNYKLAKMIGVSQTSVANWREGGMEPRKKPKAAVLNLFGVTESDIAGDKLPTISYSDMGNTGEKKKEKPHADGEGLRKEIQELIRLYDNASPAIQAAALAVLKSAGEGQTIPDVKEEEK